jgi:hypothetical protein
MSIIYSDFWLNDVNIYDTDDGYSSFDIDLIKLANGKRAVSNFVRILTNKSIPVLFNNKDANMTDGSTVYLSADIKEKEDFDVAVGLALHEGSHILLSDFDVIKTLWQRIPREIYDLSMPKNISKESVVELTKTVLNYVEDRYIDKFVYDSAPGYRGYYISLYDTYFNSVEVSKSLSTKIYRVPTIDAYLFRIINFTNPSTDLSALPELYIIFKLIDYTNILIVSIQVVNYLNWLGDYLYNSKLVNQMVNYLFEIYHSRNNLNVLVYVVNNLNFLFYFQRILIFSIQVVNFPMQQSYCSCNRVLAIQVANYPKQQVCCWHKLIFLSNEVNYLRELDCYSYKITFSI